MRNHFRRKYRKVRKEMILFIAGLFIGACVAVFTMALCEANGSDEEAKNEEHK